MLPRKGSNSYRTIHPLPALNSPSHSGSGAGTARRVGGLDLAMAALGYAHSIAVIVLGTCLLLSLAPSWREWGYSAATSHNSTTTNHASGVSVAGPAATAAVAGSGAGADRWWLESPTTFGQSLLFLVSILYFCTDTLALWWRGRFGSSKGQRVLLHHVLSVIGLAACVCSGRDGPLVLVSLVLAEVSSPPLYMLQLAKYVCRASWRVRCAPGAQELPWLRWMLRPLLTACLSMDLTLLHVLVFLLTRLMALQFTAHAVMPFAALLSTKLVGTCLVLLSALLFLDMLPALQTDTPEGSLCRQVACELREMLLECQGNDGASHGSADESEHSRGSRRQTARATSGPNSPHKSPTPDDAAAAATSSRHASAKKKLFWT